MASFCSQAYFYLPLTLQSMLSYVIYQWHSVFQAGCEGKVHIFKSFIFLLFSIPKIKLSIGREEGKKGERDRGR